MSVLFLYGLLRMNGKQSFSLKLPVLWRAN